MAPGWGVNRAGLGGGLNMAGTMSRAWPRPGQSYIEMGPRPSEA
jgi:hypothetical protein